MSFLRKGHLLIRLFLGGIVSPTEQINEPYQAVYTFAYIPPGSYRVQLAADDPAGSMLITYNVKI